APTCIQGRLVRRCVDATCQPTDDGNTLPGKRGDDFLGYGFAIGGGTARADDSNGPLIGLSQRTPDVKDGRRVVNLAQQWRVIGVIEGDSARPGPLNRTQFGVQVAG